MITGREFHVKALIFLNIVGRKQKEKRSMDIVSLSGPSEFKNQSLMKV